MPMPPSAPRAPRRVTRRDRRLAGAKSADRYAVADGRTEGLNRRCRGNCVRTEAEAEAEAEAAGHHTAYLADHTS